MRKMSFTGRFLKFTIAGYFLTVLTVALAVWFASDPALEEMQAEAKRHHLITKANVVSNIVDDIVDEAKFLARNDDVVAFAIGETNRSTRVIDTLSEAKLADRVKIFDYLGRPIMDSKPNFNDTRFISNEAVEGLASVVEGRNPPTTRILYRPGENKHEARFLISIPIISSGFAEGLLAVETTVDLSKILHTEEGGPATILATPFQLQMWQEWSNTHTPPVHAEFSNGDFYMVVEADRKMIETVGQRLVRDAILVSMLALVLPFGMLAASGMLAIVQPHKDLENSKLKLAKQRAELAELAQIARMASESIIVTDENQKIVWVNDAFTKLTGYRQDEAVGHSPGVLLQGPDTSPDTVQQIKDALASKLPIQTEILNYHKDGWPYWISLSISPIEESNEKGVRFTAIATDITAAKLAEIELKQAKDNTEYQAMHDVLTGLPNRRYLDHVLENEVIDEPEPRTLVRVDLDFFKNVNDTLGHAAGDFVLQEVARILKKNVRSTDLAARVGGDEFVILLGSSGSEKEAIEITERLSEEIRREMTFEGKFIRVGVSFGIACGHSGLIDNMALLKSADAALYVAKEMGRNQTRIYNPDLHSNVVTKREVAVELEKGLVRQEFEAFFQPQFDAVTEKLIGMEALARWRHPEKGYLPPHEFLPIAEQLRVVSDIDSQVCEFGLRTVAELNHDGYFVPKISFNVGIDQLVHSPIQDAISRVDIGDTVVSLEILESVLVEKHAEEINRNVARYREIGCKIEVDDFGSGHASVVGLKTPA